MYYMTPCLSSVVFSVFGLVFFVLESLLGIARQWSREKFAILSLKPRSHVKRYIYQTLAVTSYLTVQKGRTDLLQIGGAAAQDIF